MLLMKQEYSVFTLVAKNHFLVYVTLYIIEGNSHHEEMNLFFNLSIYDSK